MLLSGAWFLPPRQILPSQPNRFETVDSCFLICERGSRFPRSFLFALHQVVVECVIHTGSLRAGCPLCKVLSGIKRGQRRMINDNKERIQSAAVARCLRVGKVDPTYWARAQRASQ